jgi:hypothetical protein
MSRHDRERLIRAGADANDAGLRDIEAHRPHFLLSATAESPDVETTAGRSHEQSAPSRKGGATLTMCSSSKGMASAKAIASG